MTPKREVQIAYILIVVFFFVGVISYAAFPAKTPDEPIRLMYKTVAGKVLFDHKTHAADSGYGLACGECHHHPEDEEEALVKCGYCHQVPAEGETYPKTCLDCHESEDLEESEVMKQSDAFHSQCESCHQEVEAGPEEDRCNWCHVM